MRRHWISVALSLLLAALNVSAQVARTSAALTSEPDAKVLVTVSGKTGEAVPTLSKESVELRIGGRPVEVEDIRSLGHSPLFFSVLVDLSGTSRVFADQESATASSLFDALSTGENHGYLVLFKAELRTNDRFVDATSVRQILSRFPAQSRSGGTALYDALVHAATVQLPLTKVPPNSRRAIFVLSDGGDDASRERLDDTVKIVQTEGVPIFAIGFAGPNERPAWVRHDEEILEQLSSSTGGYLSFAGSSSQPDAVTGLASLMDRQCLLIFKQPALKADKFYPMKLKSPAKDVAILAPTQYFMP